MSPTDKTALEEGDRFLPRYDRDGLITCVTVDDRDGAILMLAHMNADSLRLTLESGIAHYWSRSRQTLWRKGDTSGQSQRVVEIRTDCDQDALVMRVLVDGDGGACHTGRRSCFYRMLRAGPAGDCPRFRRIFTLEPRPSCRRATARHSQRHRVVAMLSSLDVPPLAHARSTRPRVGLALGGGSARGWAHIGVIRELAAAGIELDVIAGTSIGAVVGACAAAGKLDALETFARGLNRRRVFGLMDLSLAGSSLISGIRLKRRLSHDLGGLTIEGLPMPFAAIATELGSGREVCLARGNLVEAIRASYALPGVFEPLSVGGRWLFDGAMSNPVPVSVCRALGADVVIAVNLTADCAIGASVDLVSDDSLSVLDDLAFDTVEAPVRKSMRRRIFARRRLFRRRRGGAPGIASVMVGAFSVAQERISRSRLATDPPDVMVNARLSSVGLFDFHRASDLIEHGRVAVRRVLPEIETALAATRAVGAGF